ncbi:MFS transporter [Aneurinibacillus sp. Ricciae_BoGa-3]|uniref:MFS transporter n=1 Tax=Aneurinibacillus sp. Ricciae_BoGa-3 TaxID=3022697 RepID=UPI002341D348|nr:MFS transporter [Aneurinibacillus sp. Ricciae_BoGa-3]WCK54853.1 MFS transporter [Aneurinibacillus sp. Ricciae_BoGa-3]
METSTDLYARRWYVLWTVGIGTFLSSLNTSITNTVLPVIQRAIHLTLSQSEWIVLIYLLVLTLFLLPVGRLSDVWGHRRIFLFGFALFTCAALLCGFSRNYVSLLWGRALLALAGSMILSVGPALISTTFPAEQRGRVLGIQAIMTYIGLSLGPVLGGWFTQLWGWPIIFFITVPFGLAGLVLGMWAVPGIVSEQQKHLDLKGFFLFIIGMTTGTLLLNSNAITQHRSLLITILLVCFGISTWGFVHIERKQPDPMLDLRLFQIRNFGFGTLGAALNYLCFFLTMFLLPFYFDHVLQLSALATGTYLSITPLIMTVCAPIAGTLSDRIGPRILTTAGMLFSTLGLVLFGIMAKLSSVAVSHWILIIGLFLAGLGTGTFAAPNNSAILGAAPRPKQGVASGTLATFRYIGMMAGITVGGSLFDLLLSYFTYKGSGITGSFLEAFSFVMWIGTLFGVVGIMCTLAMTKVNHR